MVSTAECALVQLRSIRLAAALRGVNCVIKGRGKEKGGQEKKKSATILRLRAPSFSFLGRSVSYAGIWGGNCERVMNARGFTWRRSAAAISYLVIL